MQDFSDIMLMQASIFLPLMMYLKAGTTGSIRYCQVRQLCRNQDRTYCWIHSLSCIERMCRPGC